MGDGPGSAIKDKGRTGDHPLHSEQVTLVQFPRDGRQPPAKRDVNTGPVMLAQAADQPAPLSPAAQANEDIAKHQSNALASAKAHDTATADKELKAAISVADSNQTKATQLLADFNRTKERERQALVTALGLDPGKATNSEILAKLKSSDKLNPEQKARLESLQGELSEIKELKEAPAITRATAAFVKANGGMDAASTASPAEQLRVFQQNSQESMDLLRDARRLDTSKELVGSPIFEKVNGIVTKRYEAYQESLANTTLVALATAEKLMEDPKAQTDPAIKAQVQTEYETAYGSATKLDLKFIAAHQDDLGPKGKEHGVLELQEAANLQAAASSQKAKMLLDQGKNDQALVLMTKLQADVPALAGDPSFQKDLLRAYGGDADAEILRHQQSFKDIYFRKEDHELSEDEKKKKYGAALAELDASADLYAKRGQQLARGLTGLQAEQRSLNLQIKNLGSVDQSEKQFESARLNQELAAVNDQISFMQNGRTLKNEKGETITLPSPIKANATSIADVAYWQGSCRYQVGDLYEANERFHFAQDHDSAYAKEPAFKIDELIHATNWWSRHNWIKQGAYIVAGVAAGIVVGVLLTPETGPGGPIAGALVANGIIDAGAATTVALGVNGALWGGLASTATVSSMRLAMGDPVTAGTMIRDFGAGAGGAVFNVTRMAFAPAVLAGTVPRVVAGMAAGTSFGVVDGGANFVADVGVDHVSTKQALANYGLNVAFSAGAGAFTPMRGFASPGEVALTNAWTPRVIEGLKGAAPILIYPTIEGTVLQSGVSTVVDLTHTPFIPKADRSQERHDFSQDKDVIDNEFPDSTVKPPRK